MVGFSEAPGFLYGWTLRGSPVFCMVRFLEVLRLCMVAISKAPGIQMVGLLEAPRYSYSWTLGCLPGIRLVGL